MRKHALSILICFIFNIAFATVYDLSIVSPTTTNPIYVLPGGTVTVVVDVWVTRNNQLVRVGIDIYTTTPNTNPPGFQQDFNPATWPLVGGYYYSRLTINVTAPLTLGTYSLWCGAKQPHTGVAWTDEHTELQVVRVVSVIPSFVWSITGNKILDIVRKPGTFAGVGPTIFLRSRHNLTLTFAGFENLQKIGDPSQTILKYYALVPTTVTNPTQIAPNEWISATNLNSTTIPINNPTNGVYRKLWEKIVVSDNNTACEYQDPGGSTIIINAVAMDRWIDPQIQEREIDY